LEYDEVEAGCMAVSAADDNDAELVIDVVDMDTVSLPSIMRVVLAALL
jgi:hypothetical protein